MKAWYDDIDAATLQRIKIYSAFNDAKSKNLMMQTMYEYREKEIQDFKETNHELAETCIARKKRIAELEKENAELKTNYEVLSCSVDDFDELQNRLEEEQRKNNGLSDNLAKAKELLNEFMRISKASDEDFEHDFSELIAEAEQFLKEVSE